MPSLRDVLDRHESLLVLDAASDRVHVGVVTKSSSARWSSVPGDSGIAVFESVAALGADPGLADGFLFCEGPGSILGIRTTAMAIRTWCSLLPRPVYAYTSLALVARGADVGGKSVIADARRESWHVFSVDRGLRRVPASEIRGDGFTPAGFKRWMPLPPGTVEIPYNVPSLLEKTRALDLFRAVEAPDAFLHEEPAYAEWSPAVHRAPSR